MDAEVRKRLFNQIHDLWVQPELDRRAEERLLPPDFKIWRCLIRLPNRRAPLVQFNEEISWLASVTLSPSVKATVGTPIYWDQLQHFDSVEPPKVDEQRVAFVYLFKVVRGYSFIFDFSPNIPEKALPAAKGADWADTFGPAIAETLQAQLLERTVNIDQAMELQLQCIGLWPAPALIPYPMGEITRNLAEGNPEDARKLLVRHCTADFLRSMTTKWWTLNEFRLRKTVLEDAVFAHTEGKFTLSIHALLPQLEGIITEWILGKLPEDQVPFRQESKTKKFRELLLAGPPSSFTHRCVVECAIQFILDGPVLATFKRWFDDIETAFPNRNVVGHGRYDSDLYTEENSAKLLLLIDTLFFIVSPETHAVEDF